MKLIPKLRFPEFESDGEFREKSLGYFCDYWNGSGNESGVTEDGQYLLISLNSIDIEGNLKSDMKRVPSTDNSLKKGDLVMVLSDVAHGNFLGLSAIIPDDNYVLNQRMAGLGIKDFSEIDPKYLRLFINGNQKYFKRQGQGSSQQNLSKGSVIDFPVLVPTRLIEQQKIASCLSSLDELIAAHNDKLDALKDHKKGLLQNLFPQEGERVPKFRFPEFENDGEWVEKKLGDLTEKIGDGIHTTPKYDDSGDYFFINGNNLIDGKIYVGEKTKRVSRLEYEKHKKELNETTVLLSINGTIGNVAFYNKESVVLGKSACYMTPNQELNSIFLFYSLQCPKITSFFFSELTGSTIKNLSLRTIRETAFGLPTIQEQQKIASCLSALDELITAQQEKIEQLKMHKKGLMQGLFPSAV